MCKLLISAPLVRLFGAGLLMALLLQPSAGADVPALPDDGVTAGAIAEPGLAGGAILREYFFSGPDEEDQGRPDRNQKVAATANALAGLRLCTAAGIAKFQNAGRNGEAKDYLLRSAPFQSTIVITKTLLSPPTAAISDTVRFEVAVANNGAKTITTLPLYDYYAPACLETPVTQPPAAGNLTNAALGVLHWANVAPAGGLAPGQTVTVTVDFHANITDGMYWKEGGWIDYAPKGMPDFTQKQDQWDNPPGSGQGWYYCGPVAAANSLWWFDSKFEPNPVAPPGISDGYPLVRTPVGAPFDDHDPGNVQPLVNALAPLMGTNPNTGTNVHALAAGMQAYINNAGLANSYTVTVQPKPPFGWVEDEVRRSEDVILLLGFWQEFPPGSGNFERIGGHFVTVAGVDSLNQTIAFSDPYRDRVEEVVGAPGRVLPAPHSDLHNAQPGAPVHNDAKYASHDVYAVQQPSPSPGGAWSLPEYAATCQDISNFQGQNAGDFQNGPSCQTGWPIYTEVEYAVAVSPVERTVTCDPTTNIAVVRGAQDDSGAVLPEAQAHTRVRVVGAHGLDFGDAPDPAYPTLRANNGARHAVGSLVMGNVVDVEADGQPVDQDDVLPPPGPDDEDGVTLLGAGPVGGPYALPYVAGRNGAVRITVTGAGNGFLHGWFDWNRDGDWNDAGENVFSGYAAAAGGVYVIDFAVPAGAKPGQTWARFRLDDQNLNSPVGAASNGEVEDYPATVQALPALQVAKTLVTPLDRTVLLVGETVTFSVAVRNTGATTVTFLPLTDWFDTRCLTYSAKDSDPDETSFDNVQGRIDWFDLTLSNLQDLAPGQTFTTTVRFTVTGSSAAGFNRGEVEGATDQYGQTPPKASGQVTFTCVQPATVGDRVWRDVNANGIQDAGEAGMPQVTVQLYDSAGALKGTTTTDAGGLYSFGNVPPGNYYLAFTRPSGYVFTLQDVDDGLPNPDWRDSHADRSTGRTAVFTLTAGQNDPTRDAGLFRPGAIVGLVWHDRDGDQVQDSGEAGIANVTVILRDPAPQQQALRVSPLHTAGVIATTQTDANGNYSFGGLAPGAYEVTVDPATLPSGQVRTTNADPLQVTVLEGQTTAGVNFGYADPVTIGDYLFLDQAPVTGAPGAEDTIGIDGLGVTLTDLVRGLTHLTVSAGNGAYLFSGLPPGLYRIEVTYPAWFVMSTTPHPQTFQIDSGQSDLSRDFGFELTTGVVVHHLSAHRLGSRVVVTWATFHETGNAGFHVWRSTHMGGPYERLTAQPIPSQSVGGGGARYQYVDAAAPADHVVWYRIEAVPSGELFGPVSAAPGGRWLQFLPALQSQR